MRIVIETIPHDTQRYPTCGDWVIDEKKNEVTIYVSEMNNWRYELLVAMHEIVEAMLCRMRGIREEDVTEFDIGFKGEGEPGNDPRAPYHSEHMFATNIEAQLAAEMGVDWKEYNDVVEGL